MASPTHPVPSAPPPAAPSSANAVTAGAVASSNATPQLTGSSKINSLADLKKKAPELYKKMLEGIAMNICSEMQRHQDRLKELMRDASNPT